jgi:MFS family permease
MITLGGLLEAIAIDGYFSKNLPKEIRGVLLSIMAFMGIVGKALAIKIGGTFMDTKGRNAPFLMIGCCDAFFFVFVLIMILCGYYGNLK